jgi:glycosyltransferase involved in cell wall biosynthesis
LSAARETPADGLACVVMSLRCEPGLVRAVRSLLDQDEPLAEIVVVNSGGGDAAGALRAARIDVPVVERDERLNPGAVRNLGLDATTARWVAFLAADCWAEPGWAAGRLREHRAGAATVTSMITNPHPESDVSAAAFLLNYGARTIVSRRRSWAAYSLSYDRALFEEHGRFREDMRIGEDTEFKRRLAPMLPAWATDVRTAHANPTSVRALVRDQWERSYRRGAYYARHQRKSPMRFVTGGIWTLGHSTLMALDPNLPDRGRPARVLPLLALGVLVRVAGGLWGYADTKGRLRET